MVTLQRASAAARDGKRHLAIGELHLEVIVLRLFSRSTKRVEEMDDRQGEDEEENDGNDEEEMEDK